MKDQLELFLDEEFRRIPYWREELKSRLADAFRYRHRRYSTAWSMAVGLSEFAGRLCDAGAMSVQEARRWGKFDERLLRWEARP